jgi:DNA polymerase-3 subunit delta'
LTHAAANSFLKNLEEPVEKTCIILITDFPSALPATIRSRCQMLFVPPPESKAAIQWLQQNQISEHLDILLEIAQGSPLIALEYAKDGVLESRMSCFNDWLKISRQQASPVSIAEQWLQFSDSLLLFWMTSWVVDTLKCYFNQNPAKCYNPDFKSSLQELAQRLELKKLFKFYDLLLRQNQCLSTQLNKQLIFEEILINWSQLNRK